MHLEAQLKLAQAEELLAAAVRLIHSACGEDLAVRIATELVESHARRATTEQAYYLAQQTRH